MYDKICECDIVILLRIRGAAAKNSFCIIHISYVRAARRRAEIVPENVWLVGVSRYRSKAEFSGFRSTRYTTI